MTAQTRGLIATDPGILHGEPHVRGTRVPVAVIVDSIASGMSEGEVVREYPSLTIDGVRAALRYGTGGSLSSAPSGTSRDAKELE
ncbi:MAG: DUF433 domain-containing protein [Actinomycetota bacterium]|nr:DUF433 domain-containing protein [Actinomycetota bacterium]